MTTHLYLLVLRWHLLSDKPLPAWLERACAHNPRLARARLAEEQLSTVLQRPTSFGLGAADASTSPFLAARIKHSLRSQALEPAPRSSALWLRARAGLAGVAALAVAAVWFFPRSTPEPLRPSASVPTPGPFQVQGTPPSDRITHAVVTTASAVSGNNLMSWNNPLRNEMANVVADTFGAVRFLAGNFLPSSSTPPALAPRPRPTG